MATLLGTAFNFGFTGTDGITISGTGVGTLTLQSADHEEDADVAEVRDADGDVIQRTYYNAVKKASIEYLVKGSTIADAKTQSTIPLKGALVTITACDSMPSIVHASEKWEVVSSKIGGGNTDYKKVTLGLEKRAGVQAATSAS